MNRSGPSSELLTSNYSWMMYLPIILSLILRVASSATASISYLVLAFLSLFGGVHAILAVSLSWLFTMINPGLVPAEGGGGAGRYAVLISVALSSLIHNRDKSKSRGPDGFLVYTTILGAFFFIHSVVFSPIVDVSLLKATSWTIAMSGILLSWLRLSSVHRHVVVAHMYWGLVLILVFSLPFLIIPQGYLVNGTGFQGILNHPQAFGATMSLLGSWSIAKMLGERSPAWSAIVITGTSMVMVLLSESRSAGLSMAFGTILALTISPAFAGTSLINMAPGLRSGRIWGVLFLALLAAVGLLATLSSVVQNFISKSNRSDATGIFDAYEGSRGSLIDTMLANINNYPWSGIGFGIASNPSLMIIDRDPVLGLPVGAAVEKGVAPLAVLEEVGIFGAVLVTLWVFYLLRRSSRGGLAPFSVCLTALFMNMGENTLFSPGGQGLIVLVLFGWAYASGKPANSHN